MSIVADIIQQACNIYLLRARNSLSHSLSYELVEQFLAAQHACPEGSPGEHVLIWAIFVVAAECSSPQHRVLFVNKFRRYYQRLGFSNTLKAIELLEKIWSISDGQRWTSFIAQRHILII